MEYRKLQKTGGSTYIISLPKEWVLKNKLNEGDSLFIKEKDNNLIISRDPNKEKEPREAILEINDENENLILRKLIAIYLKGYNTIKIISKKGIHENFKNAIDKFLYLSLGIEIVEETNNYVTLQDLSKFSDLPINKMLQRMYIMTENMLNDVKNLFTKYNGDLADSIIDRDIQIDRTFLLISKQFYMSLNDPNILLGSNMSMNEAFNIRSISKLFERIGDHIVNISSILKKNRLKYIKEIENYFNKATEIFKNAYLSYKTLNIDLANEAIDNAHYFSDDARKFITELEKNKLKDVVNYAFIVESLIRIAMYSSDIAEITIDEKMMKII